MCSCSDRNVALFNHDEIEKDLNLECVYQTCLIVLVSVEKIKEQLEKKNGFLAYFLVLDLGSNNGME